jgi:PKD repeat protein
MKILNPFSTLVVFLMILLFAPGEALAQVDCGGCTDATACNFNPAAAADDGSCVYTPECFLWAANDVLCINENEPIAYNVLCNDQIIDFPFFIEAQGDDCFSISEDGQVIQNSIAGIDCCGDHVIPYLIFVQGGNGTFEPLQATLTITVKCGKPDCSIIDLSAMLGDADGTGNLVVVRCFDVCENSVATLQFPFNPLFGYDWVNVVGGVGNPGTNPAELIVSWNGFGTGFVTLDVYDANGVTTTYNFCVNILEGPTAACTSPGYVCLNSPICFTNLSTNADGYHWDFGDGNTSIMSDPCHTYAVAGTYTVTLTATKANYDAQGNPLCCCTDVKTETIEVDDLPGPSIYWVSTLCEGDNSDYWTDAMNCGSYFWTVLDADGNPVIFSGQGTANINVTWGLGPVGTVTLAVTGCDASYCSNPTSVTVPIIPANGAIDGPTIVCEFTTETYCLPKWQSTVYDWTVTGGTITSATDGNCVTVVWGPMGIGTLQVDYWSDFLAGLPNQSGGGCTGSANLAVNIVPAYTVNNLGLSSVCIGDVSNVQTFSSPNPNCAWTITPSHPFTGDGTDQISISWTTGGTYVIEAMPLNPMDYCNGPESIIIQVQDIPAPTAIDGPLSVCPNTTHYYSIPSPNPSVTYYWSALNGNLFSTTGTSVGVDWFNVPGPFTLTVYAQSNGAAACSSDPYTITIDDKEIDGPLAISPGIACSNTISSHTLTPGQDVDAIITWSVDPVIAGSVLIQNDENTQIQWNDWSGTAELIVQVELCGNVVTESIFIPVNQPIEPIIVQTGILCPGVNATLSTTVPFASYAWSTSDNTPTTLISTQGNYSVTTVDFNGCSATSSFDANEVPGPTAAISTGNSTTICLSNPHTVTLIAQFNANNTYQWYCGGSLVPGATNTTFDHPFQGVVGSYSYFVVVTDINTGCMSTSDPIVVSESDCPPNPCDPEPHAFNITNAQNQFPNCNVIDFEATMSNATFNFWNFGDTNTSSSNPTSHTYTTAGCYFVVANGLVPDINGNGNCSVSDARTVCVPVAAEFDFAFLSCTNVQFNEFATFINTDPANTIMSYAWDFDGFGTSTMMNPSFDFALPIPPGNHPVTLTVTTVGGCQATITHNVFVDSVGATNINIAAGPTCVGDPINMTALASGATEYNWDFGDGATFLGASTAHTYTTAGSYVITVVSSNAAGCFSTLSVPITIFPAIPDLVISANPGLVLCQGETTILTAPPGYSYLWSNGFNTQSITVGAGFYDVLLTDANGCLSLLAEVEVVELPLPNATISGNPFICDAGCTTLSVPFGAGFNYQWYDQFGFLLGNSNTQSVCTPLSSNQFFVEVTDQNGCTNVSPPFDVFLASSPFFTVSVAPSGCAGELNTLAVSPVQPGVTYVWSDGTVGPVMTTTQAGTYYVTGTDDNTGCNYSSQGTVNPLPNLCLVPVGCYTACNPYDLCAPLGYISYQWNLNNSPIPGATLACYTATVSGTYTVTATNNFGCSDTSGLLILEIIPCDDCESLSVSFTPAVIANVPSPCCFDLHYNNGFSAPLQGMSIFTADADLAFDPSSINPLLSLVGNTSNSVDLASTILGGPIPTGVLNNVISLCLENVVNSPQTIYIDWYDFNNDVVCQDSLIFNCPVEPDCLYLQDDEIYCEDGQTVYNFTVCNPNDADFSVGYFTMDNITPGGLVVTPSGFTPAPAIAPGSCQSFTAILSGPSIGGDVFCYNLIAHDFDPLQVDTALCCSLDTLYCIDIPPCDPCEDVGIFDVSSTDIDDCCVSVNLFNNYSPAFFDEIAVCALSPATTLTVSNFIGSGWVTNNYTGTSFSLIPDAMFGNFVPGGVFSLPEICTQTDVAPPQLMEIKWMVAGEVVCRDTVLTFCEPDCGYFTEETIDCNQNTWDWSATLTNSSDFVVSEAVITFNDPALSAYNQTISTGSLFPGGSFGPVNVSIGLPAFAGQTICFTVTLHEVGPNGQYLSCCNFAHCITLPDCDFNIECVCSEDFYDAVQLGYTSVPSGGTNSLGFTMTNSAFFGECDLIYWGFGDGSPYEITTGLQSILHTFPSAGVYTVCIKVFRTATDGTECSDSFCTEVIVIDSGFNLDDIIYVYPNPNSGNFKIAIIKPLEESLNVTIYDGTQRLVHSRTLSTSKGGQIQDIDLSSFEKGVYYIHFRKGDELHVEKVIIL